MQNMPTPYVVVLITAPSKEVAREIARALVERKLAACVNIIPMIESIYAWEGKIEQDEEVLLLVKTREELLDALVPAAVALHPYDQPEVIALPIVTGSESYLAWIGRETR